MEYDILPPTNDLVFKMLFGDERNVSILKNFLQAFVELPDEEYELIFLNTYVKPEYDGDKLGILDIKVRTKTGKVIDIEIQVNPVQNIGKRLSFYKSKMIVEQIGETEPYSVIEQVICLCITDYPIFPRVPDYWNTFWFYNPKNGLRFKEIPEEIHTIELPKVPEASDGSAGWKWLRFLQSKEKEEFEMVAVQNPEIRKAVNTLYEISGNEQVRAEYEYRRKAQRDWISGIDDARREGMQERERDIARNLKTMGVPLEQIIRGTGLTEAQIKEL